jgi:hypothetical protein
LGVVCILSVGLALLWRIQAVSHRPVPVRLPVAASLKKPASLKEATRHG